jgi:hypothetical protein
VLGAVGLLGLGGFAYWGVTAENQVQNLRTTCAPNCSTSSVNAARQNEVVADVSLAVGLTALGIGTWLLFAQAPPKPGDAAVGVAPIKGGIASTLAVSF